MRHLACLFLLAAALFIPGPARAGAGDAVYANARFGYSLTYPADLFTPGPESENGDGRTFDGPDGARLLVFASHNALGSTVAAAFDEERLAPGLEVTYSVKKKDWFVVSGVKDGMIVYRKSILKDDVWHTLELTYPYGLKARIDPLVEGIVSSFKTP